MFRTMSELFALGLGPVFETPPTDESQGGGGTAVEDPPEGDAGEGGDAGDGASEPQRETFEDRLQRIAEADDLSEVTGDEGADPDAAHLQDAGEDAETSEEDKPSGELPDGYSRTDDGRIRGPDGKFYSADQVEALRAGEDVEPVAEPDETEAAGDEGGEDEPLVVSVPGREPDDPDVELPLDAEALEELGISAQEARERVQQLRNGYMRREELHRHMEQVQTDRAELEFIEQQLAEAPEDFILGHVSPDIQQRVVERVLATMDDDQFRSLVEKVAGWERDPVSRRDEAVRLREERLERREQLRRDYQRKAASTERAVEIGQRIDQIVPESWPDDKRRRFFRFSVAALEDHIRQNQIEDLDPADVPQVLGRIGILDDFGLADRGASETGSADGSSASSAGSDGSAGEAEIERAKRAGEEVRERVKRRKDAAATAPAGAGSSVLGGAKPPKGQSFEERMNWLEKRLGVQ